jgi:hypothetical protein
LIRASLILSLSPDLIQIAVKQVAVCFFHQSPLRGSSALLPNLLVDRGRLIQIPRKDELIGYVEQDPRTVVLKQAQLQG